MTRLIGDDIVVRRHRMLDWLRAHPNTTALVIARECPAYEDIRNAWWASPSERAYKDLHALHRKGLVVREGRPAKWRVA